MHAANVEPMKTLQSILTSIALLFCISPFVQGAEYKTLKTTPGVFSEIDVLPSDIVEVVGYSNPSGDVARVRFQFEDDSWSIDGNASEKPTITGIKKIRLNSSTSFSHWVTIKITPADAVAPTTVLVLPESPGGNYDLLVESSGDLNTWVPFHSQAVQSGATNAFFRVRIVKK